MSLKEAVLDLAQTMENDLSDIRDEGGGTVERMVKSYIRELRAVAKAAGDPPPPQQIPLISPDTQHRMEIERAKAEFRGKVKKIDEDEEIVMQFCQDGPCEGVAVPLNVGMPPGARTRVDGHVYEMAADGGLKHVPHKGN